MRLRIILVIPILLITLVACNLGSSNPTPQPLFTATPFVPPPVGSKPTVTVLSPNNGDQFPVNQPIIVNATAIDASGVTRVQLFANGSPVKTISSVSSAGDTTLTATLDYTPRAVGTVNLRVLAFRGAVSSDPVDLQVVVSNAQSQPTSIPQPNNNGGDTNVVIPQDGVCRILTTSTVNFRSAPTTTQSNVLFMLPPSTLAPVVARLGDNSWWKINVNSRFGWVSAQVVTLTGNCFSIPIESQVTATPNPTNTPIVITATTNPIPSVTPTPLKPDLIVTNIAGRTTIALGGGTVVETYSVTITNVGLGSAGQFSAVLTVNNGSAIDLGTVGGLMSGQSVVLQAPVTYTASGTYNLRADVDLTNTVVENSEVNNRGDITVTVTN